MKKRRYFCGVQFGHNGETAQSRLEFPLQRGWPFTGRIRDAGAKGEFERSFRMPGVDGSRPIVVICISDGSFSSWLLDSFHNLALRCLEQEPSTPSALDSVERRLVAKLFEGRCLLSLKKTKYGGGS